MKQLDPAEKLLELKVCDPAMGSGHFLINLVDHLADRVITAMAEAEALVDDYISPLTERIDVIRNTIMGNAEERGWAIDVEQLDDRHIVRRMILKRCVYGVDKNPMAVELAKVSLWRTVELPGSSPPLRGQSVRFMGPHRDRQGNGTRRTAFFARAVKTGYAGGGEARELLDDERFFNWQVVFTGVWSEWESNGGRVVRIAAPRDRPGPTRGRPQAHDRRS